jgi:hypothetical protein
MDYLVVTLLVAVWCIGAPTLFLMSVAADGPEEQ